MALPIASSYNESCHCCWPIDTLPPPPPVQLDIPTSSPTTSYVRISRGWNFVTPPVVSARPARILRHKPHNRIQCTGSGRLWHPQTSLSGKPVHMEGICSGPHLYSTRPFKRIICACLKNWIKKKNYRDWNNALLIINVKTERNIAI